MKYIPNTTLCCIDCLNHDAAVAALEYSLGQCQFDKALLLTDIPVESDKFEIKSIPRIASSQEYSLFVLKELYQYIDTEYVLLIQWDGFVTYGELWQEQFFDYDYIGAPWPWEAEGINVGNGGFSLRSKRLLEALQDPRAVSQGPEDEDICKRFRSWLENDYGIRFAPSNLARQFSFERGNYSGPSFGFHGMFNMHYYLDSPELSSIIDKLPHSSLSSPEALELAVRLMRNNDLNTARQLLTAISKATNKRADVQYLLDQCQTQSNGNDALDITQLLGYGHNFQQAQELRTALQLYQLATLIDPQHPEPSNLIGMLCIEDGQLENALQFFKKASALQPETAMYYRNSGYTLLELGRPNESVAYFQKALELDPKDTSAATELAAISNS
jgi:tetratricopeptide (TPR) repeat protein